MKKDGKSAKKNNTNKNYNLKSDAVKELADANTEQVPEYSEEELHKYLSRKGFKIPEVCKIIFTKFWFAGAVCFFFLWGLGIYIGNMLDMLFVLGIALGAVTDLLTNSIIRFMEKTDGANDRWMMFPGKGVRSFFLNIIYSFVIIFCVYQLYNIINYVIITITGSFGTIPLGVEPILFGVFCMGFDLLFIGAKQMMKSIITDAKNAAKTGNHEDTNKAG